MNTQVTAISTIPASSVAELIRVVGFIDELLRFYDSPSSVSELPAHSVLPFLDIIHTDLTQVLARIDSKKV